MVPPEHSSKAWTFQGLCPPRTDTSPIPLLPTATRTSILRVNLTVLLPCFGFSLAPACLSHFLSGPSSHCLLCTCPSGLLAFSQAHPVLCSSRDFANVASSAYKRFQSILLVAGSFLLCHSRTLPPHTLHLPSTFLPCLHSALVLLVCFSII